MTETSAARTGTGAADPTAVRVVRGVAQQHGIAGCPGGLLDRSDQAPHGPRADPHHGGAHAGQRRAEDVALLRREQFLRD